MNKNIKFHKRGCRKLNPPVISTEARMLSIWEPVQESRRETLGGTHREMRGNGAALGFFFPTVLRFVLFAYCSQYVSVVFYHIKVTF